MDIHVPIVLVLVHLQQRVGIADPDGFRHLIEAAIGIGSLRERGIEGLGRIDQLLHEGLHIVLLQRAEYAQINGQMVVEGLLRQVELGNIGAIVVRRNHRPMVHHTHRGSIVGRLRTTTEGDMVVLHESRPLNALAEVGVGSLVDIAQAECRCCLSELVGMEHIHALVNTLETDCTVVRDMKLRLATFLRGHLNHARSAS